jgi:hypothetical protein
VFPTKVEVVLFAHQAIADEAQDRHSLTRVGVLSSRIAHDQFIQRHIFQVALRSRQQILIGLAVQLVVGLQQVHSASTEELGD